MLQSKLSSALIPMDNLQATYREDDDGATNVSPSPPSPAATTTAILTPTADLPDNGIKEEPDVAASEDASSEEASVYGTPPQALDADQPDSQNSPNRPPELELELEGDEEVELDEEDDEPSPKKQKQLSDLPKPAAEITETPSAGDATAPPAQDGKPLAAKLSKKTKKKNKDVWTTTSRKGKKKTKHAFNNGHNSKNGINGDAMAEDRVFINPIPRFPDKNDDSPESSICLSKVYKAEKVELSEDRLSASSTKGYRMVRATRGVTEGAWYFEIKVVHLGETGHTRLGWTTEKGDLQAPVGYDANSFGYRDTDGSKVHKALREKFADEGYKEGDVIGFYINLPDGGAYAPDPPRLVWHKGQRYICAPNVKEESLKVVPGEYFMILLLH